MVTELPCMSQLPQPIPLSATNLSSDALDAETPLNAAELNVLRAQYEKEGEMVGVQTKFNYAWVSLTSCPLLDSN